MKRSSFISNLLESYILLYPEAWFQGVFLHLALCGKEQICICLVWIYVAFVKIYNSQKTVGFYLRILILGTTLDAYFIDAIWVHSSLLPKWQYYKKAILHIHYIKKTANKVTVFF